METRSKVATCIRCSVVFSVRDPLAPRGNRVPHILHCGHSICENCLLASLQVDASVACTKCSKQSLQKQGMKNLSKEFPINLFVLGQFIDRYRSRVHQDSKITFVPPNTQSISRSVSTVSVKVVGAPQPACSECSEKDAEWSCENCPANYCSPCFTKVHAAARSLKAHVRAPITVHAIPMCSTHDDQRKDFFCHQCNEIICPCCAISCHAGHPVVTRTQMNEEYMDNVLAAVMVATAVLEEITKSQQELLNYLPAEERPPGSGRESVHSGDGGSGSGSGSGGRAGSSSGDVGPLEEVERAVSRHFAYAHGMLQLQEVEMLERLGHATGAAKGSARAALRELAGAAERTRTLLAEANRVATTGQLKWCDLRELTKRLLETRHERCRLGNSELSEARLRFHVDSDLTSYLMNHCHLEIQEGSRIQLEPLGDSPTTSSKPVAAPAPSSTTSNSSPVQQGPVEAEPTDTPTTTTAAAVESQSATSPALLPSSKPQSPFTPIATASIVATAAAAALAANSSRTESPVVAASSSTSDNKPVNHNTNSSRNSRGPPRRSSRGRQTKKGRDNKPASPHSPIAHLVTFRGSANIQNNCALPILSVPPFPPFHKPTPTVVPDPVLPFHNNNEVPPQKPFVAIGKPEVVRVVHIKNPTAFYVHRDQDKQILDNLQKFLDICPEREHLPPDTVTIGQMYICKFLVDDKWYRVIVKSSPAMLNPPESRDAIVDVFYVDYGNSERIPLSRLRPLPPQLKDVPPYALHCALFDLYPRKGDQWLDDANRAFCKMVNGAHVHMNVMAFKDDIYYIDLCAIPGMKHTNFPVSMRDAMVFMDLAQLKDETSLNIRQASSRFDSEYLKEEQLVKNENFPVVLSHIDNPSQFYAQRRGCHAEYLTKLLDDMSKYYNIHKEGMIYDPGVGMPCAAQFSLDKGWYRAKVLSIPRKSWVEVLYVDYGNKEEVPYTNIRKMPEMFMLIPPQAIECSLADVMPTKGNTWPKTATEFFLSITKDKELRLLISDASKSYMKVVLYEEKENVDVCLNALLVREGHALSIGVGASIVDYFKVEAAVPEEATQFQTIQPSRRKFRRTVKSDPGGVGFLAEDGKNVPGSSGTADLPGASAGPLFSMPVSIVTVNSPGCLYVSPCSNEEEISNLIADMQEFYNNVCGTETNWQENEKCCAWSDKNSKWYRAVILEMQNDKAKVFYKDTATTDTVLVSNLRHLDENFANVHDGAFRCHMVGIHPAGGQNKWSSVACEMFSYLVNRTYTELFITKKGDIEDNSLPIELWARCTVSPGPLEPNRIEWISLNQVLVDKGMAIPTTMPESQEMIETDSHSFKSNSKFMECDIEDTDAKRKIESIDNTDSSEEENYRHELLLFPENPKRQWLDAPPLKRRRFVGMTTYVDSQGLIHLYDIENMETLVLIREALNKCLKDSKPKPQDSYWFPGQMCLAQFYADKHWYRGKIVKENENNMYEVLFVDYGNIESCNVDMLRKDVMMAHIPIVCRKYQLSDILPASCDGKWDMDHLDFLHATLDGKRSTVIVRSSLDDPCPSISLTLPGKIDVAQLLVSLHYAIFSSNVLENDTASTAGSENSVIIENVEETIEIMGGCADVQLNIRVETHNLESNKNLTSIKPEPNDVSLESSENKSDSVNNDNVTQNTGCCSQISKEEELKIESEKIVYKTEEGICNSSIEKGGGGDFPRKEIKIELKNSEGGDSVTIGEFGDVAESKLEEGVSGSSEHCSSFVSEKCVENTEANTVHDNSSSLTINSPQTVIAPKGLDCTIARELKNSKDSNANNMKVCTPKQSSVKEPNVGSENEQNILAANTSEENHRLWSEEVEEHGELMESCEEVICSYNKLNLEECDTIFVEVTIVMDDPTQIVVVPVEDKNEKIICGVDFNFMTLQMQDEAPYRPVIAQPRIGQPCCALYSEDMQWYRASIIEVQNASTNIRVEFVDYGNIEWIDINRIHTIKPAWMTIPAQAIKCSIWNVKIPGDSERRMLVKVITKLIFNSLLIAKIKKRSPLAVELYKYNTDTLVYQPLLDTGLLVGGDEKEGETRQEIKNSDVTLDTL